MSAATPALGEEYRILRLIGEGGMGSVYEAERTADGVRCAVKVLHETSSWNPEAVWRFHREARAAAAVDHAAIVRVFDVGRTEEGTPFIVMEFIEGESLGQRLRRDGVLAPEIAIRVMVHVLSGLEAAHRAGVIHRDVKPDNIHLIGETDAPAAKLLDFGVSRFIHPETNVATLMTRTGAVLGTPHYMAPEQARGDNDLDHRVDVFAAGAVLYEATLGAVAFPGTNYNQVMARILSGEFRAPSEANPSYPAALEAVVLRAMAHRREDRYGSAAAVVADLQPLLDDPERLRRFVTRLPPAAGAGGSEAGARSVAATFAAELAGRKRRMIGGAVAAAAVAAGLLLWAVWPSPRDGGGTGVPREPATVPAAGVEGPDDSIERGTGVRGRRSEVEEAEAIGSSARSATPVVPADAPPVAETSLADGGEAGDPDAAAAHFTGRDGGTADATVSPPSDPERGDAGRPARRDARAARDTAGARPGITREVPF
jgi:hypothetical protein